MPVQLRRFVFFLLPVCVMIVADRLLPAFPEGSWAAISRQFVPTLLAFLIFVFGFWRPVARDRAVLGRANDALQQGRVTEALAGFDELKKSAPTWSVSSLRTGYAKLLLWRLPEARADLEYARRRGASPEIAGWLAITLGLLGDRAAAQELLGELSSPKADRRVRPLVEAVLAARAGDFAAALRPLSSFEVKQLPGTLGAFARALEAWALERTSGSRGPVDRVAIFGETGGEGLRKAWPEFCRFLDGVS